MAAPPEASIKMLSGTWLLDKKMSGDMDSAFKLQGLSWLKRKAIGMSTINTEFTQFTETDPNTNTPVVHLTADQYAAGGTSPITESRVLDWADYSRADRIFGNIVVRSRFVNGVDDGKGNIRPDLDLQTAGSDGSFLKEISSASGEKLDEDLSALFIQDYIVSSDAAWTTEQIWAFEFIDGERFLTRRALISNGSKFMEIRVVYRFVKN
ncbi:hypothetical protein PISL3812_03919 [Talaromyces islandicus]|uniref:Lipocalin-like domain-containing protein n=1 Tax=Talaromyces islandicus TaxID=28573 RepID=A0A0U1LVT7_TALIS|nr:hypothetical protein PISL3812_03919 [Talaromyces islandicus]